MAKIKHDSLHAKENKNYKKIVAHCQYLKKSYLLEPDALGKLSTELAEQANA